MFQQILNYNYFYIIFENYLTQMVIDRSIVQLASDVKKLCQVFRGKTIACPK